MTIEEIVSTKLDLAKEEIIKEILLRYPDPKIATSLAELISEHAVRYNISREHAVEEFVSAFNRKYRTNLRRLITGYKYKNYIKDPISPEEYLEIVNKVNHGIEVMRDLSKVLKCATDQAEQMVEEIKKGEPT